MDIMKVTDAVNKFVKDNIKEEGKVTRATKTEDGWEVDVLVLEPNKYIKSLELPVSRPVIDKNTYAFVLDNNLKVVSYEQYDVFAQRKREVEEEE